MKGTKKGRPLLICFVGIDGSGKSEQARRTVAWLNGQGVRTQYVWNIFEPWLLGFPMKVARRLFLRGKDMFGDYDEYREARGQVIRKSRLATIFNSCFFVEYLVRFSPRVKWAMWRGKTVVCDRYVFDAAVGAAANFGHSDGRVKKTVRGLLRFMPGPDVVFFIDLPEEVAFRRKNDIPSPSYLTERRRLYLALADDYGMIVVDGCMPVEEIQAAVREAVSKRSPDWIGTEQPNAISPVLAGRSLLRRPVPRSGPATEDGSGCEGWKGER